MDGYTRHTEAVQIICRICFDKKLKGDLRPLTSIGEHIVRYYDINQELEQSFGFFPQRVCKDVLRQFLKEGLLSQGSPNILLPHGKLQQNTIQLVAQFAK